MIEISVRIILIYCHNSHKYLGQSPLVTIPRAEKTSYKGNSVFSLSEVSDSLSRLHRYRAVTVTANRPGQAATI